MFNLEIFCITHLTVTGYLHHQLLPPLLPSPPLLLLPGPHPGHGRPQPPSPPPRRSGGGGAASCRSRCSAAPPRRCGGATSPPAAPPAPPHSSSRRGLSEEAGGGVGGPAPPPCRRAPPAPHRRRRPTTPPHRVLLLELALLLWRGEEVGRGREEHPPCLSATALALATLFSSPSCSSRASIVKLI